METAMTTQQGLNEVVINKVQRMIENKAVGVQATMERLVNEGENRTGLYRPYRGGIAPQ